MSGEAKEMADKKIGGFDKYEVESAARTLIEAVGIKSKPKFFAVVKKEVKRQAVAAQQAALEKKVAAKLINLDNPHPRKKGY